MGVSKIFCFSVFLFFCVHSKAEAPQSIKIKGLEDLGIKYEATRRFFSPQGRDSKSRHPSDNYILDIQITDSSQKNVNKLAKLLSLTENIPQVGEEGPKIDFVRFLPPFMRALNGRQFHPMEEKFDWPKPVNPEDDYGVESVEFVDLMTFRREKVPLTTLTNCYTTVYEFLRSRGKEQFVFEVTWLSRAIASHILTDKENADKITKDSDLQLGDFITFSTDEEKPGKLIQHAAVFILQGLYFEKTDQHQDDAFRLVVGEDMEKKYEELLEDQRIVEHFRLKKGVTLPKLSESRNLAAMEKGFYKRFYEDNDWKNIFEDLKTISLELDLVPNLAGNFIPSTGPFRIHGIEVKDGQLDRSAPIFSAFKSPVIWLHLP